MTEHTVSLIDRIKKLGRNYYDNQESCDEIYADGYNDAVKKIIEIIRQHHKQPQEVVERVARAAPEVAAQNHVAASSPAPDTQEKPKTAMFRRTNSEKKEETKEETAA